MPTARMKKIELADLYEVFRAIAQLEGIKIDDIVTATDEKKAKSGGFDEAIVLLQTGILGRGRNSHELDRQITQVLARRLTGSSYELPFTFFGFMELDQARSILFDDVGIRIRIRIRLSVILRSDRLELTVSRLSEQLELPLDLVVNQLDENGSG